MHYIPVSSEVTEHVLTKWGFFVVIGSNFFYTDGRKHGSKFKYIISPYLSTEFLEIFSRKMVIIFYFISMQSICPVLYFFTDNDRKLSKYDENTWTDYRRSTLPTVKANVCFFHCL